MTRRLIFLHIVGLGGCEDSLMAQPEKPYDLNKKSTSVIDADASKSKKDQLSARKDVTGDPITQAIVAKVLNGEIGLEVAQSQFPDILGILQATAGNEFVTLLLNGSHKKGKSDAKNEEGTSAGGGADKKDGESSKGDPNQDAEKRVAALILGIVGAQLGIGHLLKNKESKEVADPGKKQADDKKKEAADKKDTVSVDEGKKGAEKKDPTKKVDDLFKKDEQDKKDTSGSQGGKDKVDKAKEVAKDVLTKKDPASEKKDPASEKKDPASEKKDPGSEKKDPASEKKDPASDKKDPASDKKDPASDKKDPASEKKDPGADKKDPGADKKDPGADKKDPEKTDQTGGGGAGGEKTEQPGGGGGGGETTETVTPAPVAPAPTMTGPGGTMDSYMANHPDKGARDRVTNMGFQTDKLERSSRELGGKVELPPDKSWLDAISPRQDWFALKQKLANNPWSGQDKFMAFSHNLNAGLDFVSSAVSKIGLASTVGGVILTFLAPPVGAFLLTVGRVANAISVILSGLKLLLSIVQTVVIAVKAAKEKDPIKRMEMMQQMKSALQSGVMAGIDLILSKVTGGAKGAASSAGSKAMDAAKAAFKEAKDAGKGLLKAGWAGAKAGAGAFVKGLGTAATEGFKGMKTSVKAGAMNALNGAKELIKNPLKTIGAGLKAGYASAKGAMLKPFSDLKTAWNGFSSVGKSFKQFNASREKDGYLKTVISMNFKNAKAGKGAGGVLKGLWKDATDKSAGGVATQIDMFMNGKSETNKGLTNSQEVAKHALEKRQKQSEFETAASGTLKEQRAYLAKDSKKQFNDLKHLDDSTIKVMMANKKKELAKSNSYGPSKPGLGEVWSMGNAVYGTVKGDMSGGDLLKTGMKASQAGALGTAAGFMVNNKAHGEGAKSWVAQAGEANDKLSAKNVEGVQTSLQKTYSGGMTEAKCKVAMSPALTMMSKREAELQGLMAQSGKKPAGPTPEGGASQQVQQGPPPPPPPPPAPPEGTVVPEESLLTEIKTQRDRLAEVKKNVSKSVSRAEDQKAQAIKGDATLTQYAAGLDQQGAEIAKQEGEAQKDQAEITQSKAKIAEGGKQVADKKGVAEGEKGKAEAKAAEGGSVAVVPDKAKQQAEEKARAEKEKAEEEAKWKKANLLQKGLMVGGKFLKSIGDFMATAAKYVMKNIIGPIIESVKSAIAKVMGFITNLLMSGVIKIIGAIMGQEAENNLNATFAQMKEMEAKQAAQAATESKDANKDAKLKLTKAQQAAKAKVDTCQANITEGKALIGEIDAHSTALQEEEKKISADREAFRAQYSPYFDWVKIYEEWQAKNGGKGEEQQASKQPAGAETNAGVANQGPQGGEENPADRPLEPTVGQALVQAAEIVKADSVQSQTSVSKAIGDKSEAIKKTAKGTYDANMATLKTASEKDKTQDMSEAYGKENDRVTNTSSQAQQVVQSVSSSHGKAESDRRARLDALIARAQALSGKKASEGLAEAKEIWRQIAEEAKGIDKAQEGALKDATAQFDAMKKATIAS